MMKKEIEEGHCSKVEHVKEHNRKHNANKIREDILDELIRNYVRDISKEEMNAQKCDLQRSLEMLMN